MGDPSRPRSGWGLAVREIEETPQRFSLEADPAWWAAARKGLHESAAGMHRPFRLDFDAHRLGRRLLLRGSLAGSADLVCSRCLVRYEEAFDEGFQLLLEPAPASAELPESGIELDPDDAEIGRYDGDRLDFGAAVLEILALAWPMQPRCADSCRGLCSSCGTNRNVEECSCVEPAVSRPFAGLGPLLQRARRREG